MITIVEQITTVDHVKRKVISFHTTLISNLRVNLKQSLHDKIAVDDVFRN